MLPKLRNLRELPFVLLVVFAHSPLWEDKTTNSAHGHGLRDSPAGCSGLQVPAEHCVSGGTEVSSSVLVAWEAVGGHGAAFDGAVQREV